MSIFNVAFSTDARYIQHLAVCIASLLENNRNRSFAIYVILVDNPSSNLSALKETIRAFPNAALHFVSLDPALLARFKAPEYLGPAAYARLYMSHLLPRELDRVLYLDCDMVVRGDITELYETDLGGFPIGAVEDLPVPHDDIDFAPTEKYFNSGTLLIDLHDWRTSDATSSLLRVASSSKKLRWPDQDMLNLHFRGRCRVLDIKWNFQAIFAERRSWFALSRREFTKLRDEACIIHFTTPTKPWNYMHEVQYRELYYRYLALTPFKDSKRADETPVNRLIKLARALTLRRKLKWALSPIIQIRNPFRPAASRQADSLVHPITRTCTASLRSVE